MTLGRIYLVFAVMGIVVPYAAFVPWLGEHGPRIRFFAEQMFNNGIASFFALDVIVSGAVVMVLVVAERRRLGQLWWLPLAGLFSVGVSLALPATLYLRERESAGRDPGARPVVEDRVR